MDTVDPQVLLVSPPPSGRGVLVDAQISADFSEAVNPGSLGLALVPDPGALTYNWNAGDDSVTADHASFGYGLIYEGTIAVRDLAGNPLAEAFVWSFETQSMKVFFPLLHR